MHQLTLLVHLTKAWDCDEWHIQKLPCTPKRGWHTTINNIQPHASQKAPKKLTIPDADHAFSRYTFSYNIALSLMTVSNLSLYLSSFSLSEYYHFLFYPIKITLPFNHLIKFHLDPTFVFWHPSFWHPTYNIIDSFSHSSCSCYEQSLHQLPNNHIYFLTSLHHILHLFALSPNLAISLLFVCQNVSSQSYLNSCFTIALGLKNAFPICYNHCNASLFATFSFTSPSTYLVSLIWFLSYSSAY